MGETLLGSAALASWQHGAFSHSQGSLNFSRSDQQQGGVNLSRIDRFYVGDYLGDRGGSIEILAGTTFFDHAPIILTLEDQARVSCLQLRIPERMFSDDSLVVDIERIWQASQSTDLDAVSQCALGITQLFFA